MHVVLVMVKHMSDKGMVTCLRVLFTVTPVRVTARSFLAA
jgi:hypothetical protein